MRQVFIRSALFSLDNLLVWTMGSLTNRVYLKYIDYKSQLQLSRKL